MYEIIDDNGVIHSGSASEMMHAFQVMNNPDKFNQKDLAKYLCAWRGDLKLVRIIFQTKKTT